MRNVQLDQRLAEIAPPAIQWKSKHSRCRSTIPPPELHVEYIAGHCKGPRQMILSEDVLLQLDKTNTKLPITLKKADFVWLLARLRKSNSLSFGQSDSQEVPGWSGFHAAVTSQVLPQQCAISYLPVIAAAPIDLSTEYVMLKRSMAVAHKLQQENVLITLDQAMQTDR